MVRGRCVTLNLLDQGLLAQREAARPGSKLGAHQVVAALGCGSVSTGANT